MRDHVMTSTLVERKDPEEEYFRLTLLSIRMVLNEKDSSFTNQVNAKRLFKEIKEAEVPFHHWYIWI